MKTSLADKTIIINITVSKREIIMNIEITITNKINIIINKVIKMAVKNIHNNTKIKNSFIIIKKEKITFNF